MTDRPTETLRLLKQHIEGKLFVAGQMDAQGWTAEKREIGSGSALLELSKRLLQEAREGLEQLVAHSGEEPQTNGLEKLANRGIAGASGSPAARNIGTGEVTAFPVKTGDDLERDGTFAVIAEALGAWTFSAEDYEKRAHRFDGFLGVLKGDNDWTAQMLREAAALRREVERLTASPAAPVEPLEALRDDKTVRCRVCGHLEPLHLTYGSAAPWPRHCGQKMEWLTPPTAALREHPPTTLVEPALMDMAYTLGLIVDGVWQTRAEDLATQVQRLTAELAALREHPVAVETPKVRVKCPWCGAMCAQRWCGRCERMLPYEAFNELSSDPRQIEPPSGGPNDQ